MLMPMPPAAAVFRADAGMRRCFIYAMLRCRLPPDADDYAAELA